MPIDINKIQKGILKKLGMGKYIPVNVFGWDGKTYLKTIEMRDAERLVYEGFAEPIRKGSIRIVKTPLFKKKDRLYDELKGELIGSSRRKLEEEVI